MVGDTLLISGSLGALGGLTRGVVGLLKALSMRRKIIWMYYFFALGFYSAYDFNKIISDVKVIMSCLQRYL